MRTKHDSQVGEWKRIVLAYARHFADRESRPWFACADIEINHALALIEFQRSGTVSTEIGRLVSRLPRIGGSNELDSQRVEAICTQLVGAGLLELVPDVMARNAMKITGKGREYLAEIALGTPSGAADASAGNVVIITIREDEYAAVLSRLGDYRNHAGSHRSYVRADFSRQSGTTVPVFLVRSVEQGPNAGHDTARDAIEDLDPALIVVTGIAGAVPDQEFTLGDVIVATRLHDFVVGSQKEGGMLETTNQGGPMAKRVQDIVAMLPAMVSKELNGWNSPRSVRARRPIVTINNSAIYGTQKWREMVRASLQAHFVHNPRRGPQATARAIASSGLVVKDTQLLRRWRKSSRDIFAVEMELSGVYAAAQRRDRVYPVLAIRGISDIVGLARDPLWTAYACHTAASLTVSLLRNAPPQLFA